MLKFSTTERNGQLLQHDGYSYIRYTTKEHKNGSINWRCQHSRDKFGCKATCSTSGDTITRYTKVAHTKERAKNQLRKQFKEEANFTNLSIQPSFSFNLEGLIFVLTVGHWSAAPSPTHKAGLTPAFRVLI